MLKLSLHRCAPRHPWRWSGGTWSDGSSMLEPYSHPALEDYAVTDGRSTFLVVREKTATPARHLAAAVLNEVDSKDYRRLLAEAVAWPLDCLVVECCPDSSFRMTAGKWGTAPVYLVEAAGRLRGSWALADLREHCDVEALDDRVVSRILTVRHRYARETLFRNVFHLTERAQASYGGTGLSIRYPDPARHARPRDLRDGVDVVQVYRRCLAEAVRERGFEPGETAVELSGGMDSANVAATLAEEHRGEVLSYALLIGGPAGGQQVRRRAEMLDLFGFPDLTLEALPLAPLSPGGQRARGDFVDPMGEPYHEAVEAILVRARERGARTVFTGDGGDELLGLRSDEWAELGKVPGRHADNVELPGWLGRRALEAVDGIEEATAPPSTLNHSTLRGFALRTPQFLDAGLWPVSPLCSPRLIRFAEQLPVAWRYRKRVARERLARSGLSDEVVHPPERETFRHVMEHGLRRYGVPMLGRLLSDAVTVDLGFVDGDALRAARLAVARGGPVQTMLFAVVSLELALRAVVGDGARGGSPCS